jgi:hypothetical protein
MKKRAQQRVGEVLTRFRDEHIYKDKYYRGEVKTPFSKDFTAGAAAKNLQRVIHRMFHRVKQRKTQRKSQRKSQRLRQMLRLQMFLPMCFQK